MPSSALLHTLQSAGAQIHEPGVWRAWTPADSPIPASHPNPGEDCVYKPWPKVKRRTSFEPTRLCLRNETVDSISKDVAHGYISADCQNLVELFDHPLYRPTWGPSMFRNGSKETLDKLKKEEHATRSILLDIGANIGICTITLLLMTKASIVAFEPNPVNLYHLTRTLSKMAWEEPRGISPSIVDRVVVYPMGLGEADAKRVSRMQSTNGGNSIIAEPGVSLERAGIGAPREEVAPQPVIVRRLDAVFSPALANLIRVVKIDVQGYECRVLDGDGRGILSTAHAVYAESSPAHLDVTGCSAVGLRERMEAGGARWVRFTKTGHMGRDQDSANGMFIARRTVVKGEQAASLRPSAAFSTAVDEGMIPALSLSQIRSYSGCNSRL